MKMDSKIDITSESQEFYECPNCGSVDFYISEYEILNNWTGKLGINGTTSELNVQPDLSGYPTAVAACQHCNYQVSQFNTGINGLIEYVQQASVSPKKVSLDDPNVVYYRIDYTGNAEQNINDAWLIREVKECVEYDKLYKPFSNSGGYYAVLMAGVLGSIYQTFVAGKQLIENKASCREDDFLKVYQVWITADDNYWVCWNSDPSFQEHLNIPVSTTHGGVGVRVEANSSEQALKKGLELIGAKK
jgi:hypothetical protein